MTEKDKEIINGVRFGLIDLIVFMENAREMEEPETLQKVVIPRLKSMYKAIKIIKEEEDEEE